MQFVIGVAEGDSRKNAGDNEEQLLKLKGRLEPEPSNSIKANVIRLYLNSQSMTSESNKVFLGRVNDIKEVYSKISSNQDSATGHAMYFLGTSTLASLIFEDDFPIWAEKLVLNGECCAFLWALRISFEGLGDCVYFKSEYLSRGLTFALKLQLRNCITLAWEVFNGSQLFVKVQARTSWSEVVHYEPGNCDGI